MDSSILDYLSSLQGAPYTAWELGMDTFAPGAPFFGAAGAALPSPEEVFDDGTNCAGLMNLVRLARRLPPLGGTVGWGAALERAWKPLDRTAEYPAYTLLYRMFREDYVDEGHLGMLWTGGPVMEQKLFHSCREMGVTLDASVASSDSWASEGYYDLVCLPEEWLFT